MRNPNQAIVPIPQIDIVNVLKTNKANKSDILYQCRNNENAAQLILADKDLSSEILKPSRGYAYTFGDCFDLVKRYEKNDAILNLLLNLITDAICGKLSFPCSTEFNMFDSFVYEAPSLPAFFMERLLQNEKIKNRLSGKNLIDKDGLPKLSSQFKCIEEFLNSPLAKRKIEDYELKVQQIQIVEQFFDSRKNISFEDFVQAYYSSELSFLDLKTYCKKNPKATKKLYEDAKQHWKALKAQDKTDKALNHLVLDLSLNITSLLYDDHEFVDHLNLEKDNEFFWFNRQSQNGRLTCAKYSLVLCKKFLKEEKSISNHDIETLLQEHGEKIKDCLPEYYISSEELKFQNKRIVEMCLSNSVPMDFKKGAFALKEMKLESDKLKETLLQSELLAIQYIKNHKYSTTTKIILALALKFESFSEKFLNGEISDHEKDFDLYYQIIHVRPTLLKSYLLRAKDKKFSITTEQLVEAVKKFGTAALSIINENDVLRERYRASIIFSKIQNEDVQYIPTTQTLNNSQSNYQINSGVYEIGLKLENTDIQLAIYQYAYAYSQGYDAACDKLAKLYSNTNNRDIIIDGLIKIAKEQHSEKVLLDALNEHDLYGKTNPSAQSICELKSRPITDINKMNGDMLKMYSAIRQINPKCLNGIEANAASAYDLYQSVMWPGVNESAKICNLVQCYCHYNFNWGLFELYHLQVALDTKVQKQVFLSVIQHYETLDKKNPVLLVKWLNALSINPEKFEIEPYFSSLTLEDIFEIYEISPEFLDVLWPFASPAIKINFFIKIASDIPITLENTEENRNNINTRISFLQEFTDSRQAYRLLLETYQYRFYLLTENTNTQTIPNMSKQVLLNYVKSEITRINAPVNLLRNIFIKSVNNQDTKLSELKKLKTDLENLKELPYSLAKKPTMFTQAHGKEEEIDEFRDPFENATFNDSTLEL